jgi:hypothetical protein
VDVDVQQFRLRAVPKQVDKEGVPETSVVSSVRLVVNSQEVDFKSSTGAAGHEQVFPASLPAPMRLSSITKLGLHSFTGPGVPPGLEWDFDDVVFEVNVGGSGTPQWYELLFWPTVHLGAGRRVVEQIKAPVRPAPTQKQAAPDPQVARLLDHLNANRTYYTAAVIMGGDAGLRYLALSRHSDPQGNVLAEIVNNAVAGVAGNYLAFPLKGKEFLPPQYAGSDGSWLAAPPERRLITLPTPGVFAEAQLGTCNASEKIDHTRFWDWQKSPCPDEAPEITEGMLASRFQNLKDLLDVVKSDLQAPPVQIPQQPEPMIQIGDATLSELVSGLNLTDAADVLSFLKGVIDASAAGFKTMVEAKGGGGGGDGGEGGGGGSPATGNGTAPSTDAGGGDAGPAPGGGTLDAGITPSAGVA